MPLGLGPPGSVGNGPVVWVLGVLVQPGDPGAPPGAPPGGGGGSGGGACGPPVKRGAGGEEEDELGNLVWSATTKGTQNSLVNSI